MTPAPTPDDPPSARTGHRNARPRGALERMAFDTVQSMEQALQAETTAERRGLLQGIDARVKLLGLASLIAATVITHALGAVYGLLGVSILLALASHLSIRKTLLRVWLAVLFFSGLLAFPAIFLVPGDLLYRLPLTGWTITEQGLRSFGYLLGRALTSASLAILLVVTTPWPDILKALRAFGIPAIFVAILNMCYRYIFLLADGALEMFMARRSRLLVVRDRALARRLAISSLSVLLGRCLHMSQEVHLAMVARGYRGKDLTLHEFSARPGDYAALAAFLGLAAFTAGLGR